MTDQSAQLPAQPAAQQSAQPELGPSARLAAQVPVSMHATVGHMPAASLVPRMEHEEPDPVRVAVAAMTGSRGLRFWRPGAVDVARVLGWRWIIMGPALVLSIAPLLLIPLWTAWSVTVLWVMGLKLWLLAVGSVITLWVWGVRQAVRARTGAFCIFCGYSLENRGLSGDCPECGRGFIAGLSDEYRKDPAFFRRRVDALKHAPRASVVEAGRGSGGSGAV